jgi:Protein of unknown function (DUF998)
VSPAPRLGLAATAGAGFYAVALAALHVLRPDDIKRYGNTVSAYSIGSWGALSIAAFLALGAAGIAVALGLRATLPRSRAARAGAVLVGVFGVGLAVAGPARFAPDQASIVPLIEGRMRPTGAGVVHGVAGFGGLAALLAAMPVLSVSFGRDAHWRRLRGRSLALTGAALGLAVVGLNAPTPPAHAWDHGGWLGALSWRAFLGCLIAWLLVVAAHLRRPNSHPRPTGATHP